MNRPLAYALFIAQIVGALAPTTAVAAEFESAVEQATRAYMDGETKRANKILLHAVRLQASPPQLAEAYLLLGAVQSASDRVREARMSVRRALELDASAAYDPTRFPPALVDLFQHVRASMRGKIVVRCDRAEAIVEIDGRASGRCGGAVDIAVGVHAVRVGAGRRFEERRVVVALDTVANVDVKLGPIAGRVSIVTSPRGATVRLDGATIGATPIDNIDVAPGRLRIAIDHRGYKSVKTEMVVEADAPHALSFMLEKLAVPVVVTRAAQPAPIAIATMKPSPPLPRSRAKRIIGWSLLGTAGASLAIGTVFGILNRATANDFNAQKSSGALTVDDANAASGRASSQATVANTMFITAGASFATGLVLLLTNSR
ncbi:MAG: PEGA domain-containing protein [Deltaproteobacteria bacterium]|nr:PEGA domain-containing protein [Deltaproteobacteria bacterium]